MKMRFAGLCAGLLCVAASSGRAAVLASDSISDEYISSTPNSAQLDVGFAENTSSSYFMPQAAPGSVQIFTGLRVGAADVGKTFTATAASDPNFNAFVAYLTDGTAQELAYSLTVGTNGSAIHKMEAAYVWGSSADPRIDLHGYRIDSATVTVNSLTANQFNSADGYHTSGQVTVAIQGVPLPEPGSALLFLPAALGLLARRCRASLGGLRHSV